MTEVKVTTATIEIRTVKLTKALLKQFRRLDRVPTYWLDDKGNPKAEHVVGWLHGSVLGDEFNEYSLWTNGQGDYWLYPYTGDKVKQMTKQIYVV